MNKVHQISKGFLDLGRRAVQDVVDGEHDDPYAEDVQVICKTHTTSFGFPSSRPPSPPLPPHLSLSPISETPLFRSGCSPQQFHYVCARTTRKPSTTRNPCARTTRKSVVCVCTDDP